MTVADFVKELKELPQDMEIVIVGDYIKAPSVYVERYTKGDRDIDDNLIIRERVEIH